MSISYKINKNIMSISNNLMKFEIDLDSVKIRSLKWHDDNRELLIDYGRDGYFLLNYVVDEKRAEFAPEKGDLTYEIIEREESVEIVFCVDNHIRAPFKIQMHLIIKDNLSGIYFYSVYQYTDKMPEKAAIEQDRYCLYVNGEIFKEFKVNPKTFGLFPTVEETGGLRVMDATVRLNNGDYYTKYSHKNYEFENDVYGVFGDNMGAFVIKPYADYFKVGPLRQDLTLHQTAQSPVLLWHGHTAHYGRKNLLPPKGFNKIFGPVLFYFNKKEDLHSAWDDAMIVCNKVKQQMPFTWMENKLFAPDKRADIKGKISIKSDKTIGKVFVIANPVGEDWQQQCLGYSYFDVIGNHEAFEIKGVRYGNYDIIVIAEGVFGDKYIRKICVDNGTDLNVGEIFIDDIACGKILWEIGYPDFKSEEFLWGDRYHGWGQWDDYFGKFSGGVNFVVGENNEKDIPYFQPCFNMGDQEKVGAMPWNIIFDCDCNVQTATLKIAVAGVVFTDLSLELNGTCIVECVDFGSNKNDASLYRSTVHGIYRTVEIDVNTKLIKKSGNRLTMIAKCNTNSQQWQEKYSAILYDYIAFEVITENGVDKMELNKETILNKMDKVFERTTEMDFSWDWAAGVAFYGIVRAWEITKNEKYIEYLKKWVDEYIEIGIPQFTINAVSMGYTLMALYEHTNDQKYYELIEAKAKFLSEKAIRFGDGVFQHTVSQKRYNFNEQAWADTLFMSGLFLVKVGKMFGNEEYVQDGLKQFYWHVEYLQDKDSNLFYHGYDNVSKTNLSSIYWGRANGWCAITISEVLKLIDAFEPMCVELIDALRDQLAAIVRLQAEDGMWRTIINDETSYTETSASAAISTALINFSNILGNKLYRKYIQKALCAINAQIDENGKVNNVSGGTAVMKNAEGYKRIPQKRIQGWGQGLVLALLAEAYDFVK